MSITQSKISAWCDALLELCWLSALILTPLFFNVHSDRVFEPDKLTLLRSLAVLTLVLLLVKFIDTQGWQKWRAITWKDASSIWRVPFFAPVICVGLIYLISNIFSVTPSVSWAGSYQRLQGTYTTLSYLVIFFGLVYAIKNTAQIQRIATLVIVVSIPVSLYGMLQRFGLDPLPWGGNVVTRIAGHMGNAIFIGAYLIMVIPITLGRIIGAFTNILSDEDLNVADIIRSSIYIFALAIQLIALYWTGSRGPLLGLLVGLFAFIIIFLISLRNNVTDGSRYTLKELGLACLGPLLSVVVLFAIPFLPESVGGLAQLGLFLGSIGLVTLILFVLVALRIGWKWLWLSWMLLSLWGAIWLGLFNLTDELTEAGYADSGLFGEMIHIVDSWTKLPTIGRMATLLEDQSQSAKVRVFIWRGVVDMLSADEPIPFPNGDPDPYFSLRPWIGYGPEAMYVAYNNFYPPELGTVEARNASPDRAHNETWDAFVITGILGYIAWQWLYLTVFYYAFRWLGVVRGRRDTILLIVLWVVMGGLLAYVFATTRELAFVGVAFPFGSILGLILYLVYYVITARPDADRLKIDPFQPEQMLTIALVSIVIAFYVEIHFGIAIAATRTHFFVYLGVLFALGHLFPQWRETAALSTAATDADVDEAAVDDVKAVKKEGRGSRRRRKNEPSPRRKSRGGLNVASWFSPSIIWTYSMGLILATLSFNFTIFTPPPGLQIQTLDDIPTAGEIFQQSFFVNPANGFAESPFIFLLIMMCWGLGLLIIFSEMIKNGEWVFAVDEERSPTSPQAIGVTYVVIGIVLVAIFFTGYFQLTGQPISATQRVGFLTLAPLGAIAAMFAGTSLLFGRENGRTIALGVAIGGICVAFPIMVSGGLGVWVGLILLGTFATILYLLWDKSVADMVRPSLIVSLSSLGIGLLFAYLHASRIRSNFITPPSVTETTTEVMRRVAEASQFADLLSLFYVYLFFLILVASIFIPLKHLSGKAIYGSTFGVMAVVILLPIAFWLINVTNLNIIRADMVYKRGKPWDQQASQVSRDPQNQQLGLQFWENAIAVYEHALALTPREDFYFLWLGRAYLEESALLEGAERDAILETAKDSLIRAQTINPLNTDHTANLARLHTRWAGLESGARQEELLLAADGYYVAATKLSPQNSVIRNEYARMVYSFTQDCQRALDLYDQSIAADPTFDATRFELAEISGICMVNASEEDREPYYDLIFDSVLAGVELARADDQTLGERWLRAAQAYQQIGAYDYSFRAYDEAQKYANERSPLWQIQYFTANAYAASGDLAKAEELAIESLAAAPPDAAPQIQQFVDGLGVDSQ